MRRLQGIGFAAALATAILSFGWAAPLDVAQSALPTSTGGLSPTPDWTATGEGIQAYFGVSVSTAGDVDGDGYSDVIVGAPGQWNTFANEGAAFVFGGGSTGLQNSPAWTAEGQQLGASLGHSVSTAGDVNGDGYSDVIVAATRYDNGEQDEGRVFLHYGSPTGISELPSWTAEGDQPGASFGEWISSAGDVNGDGYSDVLVGAWQYDDPHENEGRLWVYAGSKAGLRSISVTPNWRAPCHESADACGYRVAGAGDVNGDGFDDVIMGAPYAGHGRVWVYHGSPTGLGAAPAWSAEGPTRLTTLFGCSVATAGDVNGDGFADVIVGARLWGNRGRVLVYRGSPIGLSPIPVWTADGATQSESFGSSLSTAGDVNGDGYSDVIIGAPLYFGDFGAQGRAVVYLGSVHGLESSPVWVAEGSQPNERFGQSVATAGDVNGDGYSDVIVGASYFTDHDSQQGRVYGFYGHGGRPGGR